ncbi:MAG: response regulator [Burkholderiales bacterium]
MAQDRITILFVDDEEAVVKTLRAIFRFDHNVLTATSGAEALELLKIRNVHVIVSDQRMPGMSGLQLLTKVREISPNTIRILLTGFSDLAAIVGSVNEGEVFRFISKPWNHAEIKSIVGQAASIATQTAGIAVQHTGQTLATAPDPSGAPPAPLFISQHLLVLDDDPLIAQAVRKLFDNVLEVHAAGSLSQALSVLQQEDVSVLVSDLRVNGEDLRPFLRILKQRYPLIQAVLTTGMVDSDEIINLINKAQIYRFTSKPLSYGALKLSVAAAMRQHAVYAEHPELLVRHQVEAFRPEEEKPSLVSSILASLQSIKKRFGLINH